MNRDLDEEPPVWAAAAVARRRALRSLRRQAAATAVDGVVGIRFEPSQDGRWVVVHGTAVRRRRVPVPADLPDEPFTTHLPLGAAALAVEAGLVPRRLVVTSCRVAAHAPLDAFPEPDVLRSTTTGILAARMREALDDVWRSAGRRRGGGTVAVGPVDLTSARSDCPVTGAHDVDVVALGVGTVLAGTVRRTPEARDLADRLATLVVPVGAGGGAR